MGFTQSANKKPKLPRKRKKKAIQAQGRKWYYDTIKLHNMLMKHGNAGTLTGETKVCKFWVNSSIRNSVVVNGNSSPFVIPVATKYW